MYEECYESTKLLLSYPNFLIRCEFNTIVKEFQEQAIIVEKPDIKLKYVFHLYYHATSCHSKHVFTGRNTQQLINFLKNWHARILALEQYAFVLPALRRPEY